MAKSRLEMVSTLATSAGIQEILILNGLCLIENPYIKIVVDTEERGLNMRCDHKTFKKINHMLSQGGSIVEDAENIHVKFGEASLVVTKGVGARIIPDVVEDSCEPIGLIDAIKDISKVLSVTPEKEFYFANYVTIFDKSIFYTNRKILLERTFETTNSFLFKAFHIKAALTLIKIKETPRGFVSRQTDIIFKYEWGTVKINLFDNKTIPADILEILDTQHKAAAMSAELAESILNVTKVSDKYLYFTEDGICGSCDDAEINVTNNSTLLGVCDSSSIKYALLKGKHFGFPPGFLFFHTDEIHGCISFKEIK